MWFSTSSNRIFIKFQALIDEGHDPNEYLFEKNKGKSVKTTTPSKAAKEPEKPKEEQTEEEKPVIEVIDSSSQEDLNDSTLNEDELILKDEFSEDIDISDDKIDENQVKNDEEQPSKDTNEDESKDLDGETSNIDNEDSINLTIGEEEEQMLRDEDDIKPKGKNLI